MNRARTKNLVIVCIINAVILFGFLNSTIAALTFAPTGWSCSGTVYSSTGGTISGASVQLYGYSTSTVTPDSIETSAKGTINSLLVSGGTWVRLATVYTDSGGHYSVSTTYYKDKSSMKIIISKSGYNPATRTFSASAGSYVFSPTLTKIVYPPPAPTNLQWNNTMDLAINTPDIFLAWTVDGNPYDGRLEVSCGTSTITTVSLTTEDLSRKFMFYSVPANYNAEPLSYRLSLRNYDVSTGKYSSYAYTEWSTVIGYDNHDGFYLNYRHVATTTWSRSGNTAMLCLSVLGTPGNIAGVNYLMLSVDVYYIGSSDQVLLSDGFRIKAANLDGSQNIKLVTQENHLLMRAENSAGDDLQPAVITTQTEDVVGDSLALLSAGVRPFSLIYPPAALALKIFGWLSFGNMILGPKGWFAHPDSEYASGIGAYCQASYRTEGSLSVSTRPIEMWATCKFLIEPTNSHTGAVRLSVSTNNNLWNGRLGMFWIDSFMTRSMDIYYGI
ncbi:MAG: hypothetical protein ACFFD4_33890 [Candidatus Odinarchaeota archaeon]